MAPPASIRRSRWRPLVVTVAVAAALAGVGGTTGAVLGGISAAAAGHHHAEFRGHGHRGWDRDGGPPVLPPAPPAR